MKQGISTESITTKGITINNNNHYNNKQEPLTINNIQDNNNNHYNNKPLTINKSFVEQKVEQKVARKVERIANTIDSEGFEHFNPFEDETLMPNIKKIDYGLKKGLSFLEFFDLGKLKRKEEIYQKRKMTINRTLGNLFRSPSEFVANNIEIKMTDFVLNELLRLRVRKGFFICHREHSNRIIWKNVDPKLFYDLMDLNDEEVIKQITRVNE